MGTARARGGGLRHGFLSSRAERRPRPLVGAPEVPRRGRRGFVVARRRMKTFGPETARCEVLVFREGVLSAVGHDLLLRATAFGIAVETGAPRCRRLDAGSLRVVTAMRNGRALPGGLSPATSAKSRRQSSRPSCPRAASRRSASSRAPSPERDDRYAVSGALTIAGTTRPIAFAVQREAGALTAEVEVQQPAFGIRPFRAMLGALRVKPEVRVRASIPAEGL